MRDDQIILLTCVDSPVRGAGLGLYIARSLVEALHGSTWVESNGIAGEGPIFYVAFPPASEMGDDAAGPE